MIPYRITMTVAGQPNMDKDTVELVHKKEDSEDVSRQAVRIDQITKTDDGFECRVDFTMAEEFKTPDWVEVRDNEGNYRKPLAWKMDKVTANAES